MGRPLLKPIPSSVIVVAAGSSSRMGGKVRKPYLTLQGKPILTWTLTALGKIKGLKQIVIVTRPDDRSRAMRAARRSDIPKRITFEYADGGARRQDSVYNGLLKTSKKAQLVLIHDAARPFPPQRSMALACQEAARSGAAILAVRVKDTVKRQANSGAQVGEISKIETTVPRAHLWLAQTPQIFRRDLILHLYERLRREKPDIEVTDDASICELFNHPVALVDSSETNLKVTRPEDVRIAMAYLKILRIYSR